jgi:hypothetical protein
MNAAAPDARSSTFATLRVIGEAGLVCGVLDIAYVFVVFGWRDGRAARILQGIAASLLGPAALSGGTAAAVFGLLIHFGVALAAAALYYALSRRIRGLLDHPWAGGAIFGVAYYLLMNLVVLRLTRLPSAPFPPPGWTWVLAAHVLCVGWPIAWVTARTTRDRA